MYKRKTFAFVADPAFKQPAVPKSFEHVDDPAYKPKYSKHKPKVAVDIVKAVSHVPPPGDVSGPPPMRSLLQSVDVSYARVVSRTPSSSSLVSEPVAPRPVPVPVVARVRVVPEAKPEIIVPAPEPEPELVPGSRAWKIRQFIKANFKS